nr:MAG TPA: hypothetical protein [Caudoviricetes sp.]DAS91539.1 MAG TPA: hypothetical protein [Caudoviricetes sp.]
MFPKWLSKQRVNISAPLSKQSQNELHLTTNPKLQNLAILFRQHFKIVVFEHHDKCCTSVVIDNIPK